MPRFVPLQRKIVLVFLTLGLLFTTGSYLGLRALVLPVFEEFETQSATQGLDRVQRVIGAELAALDLQNLEYSEWDHTYAYALGRHDTYEAENLDTAYWASLDINMMLIFDSEARLLWGAVVDQTRSRELAIENELLGPVTADHPLVRAIGDNASFSGLLPAGTAPLLVSSRPILTSLAGGPAAGTLIVGKYLDNERLRQLSARTGVLLTLQPYPQAAADGSISARFDEAVTSGRSWFLDATDDEISAYQLFSDVSGRPMFVLRTSGPRTISAIGADTVNTALVFFVAATILFLVTAWLFMRGKIVAPIISLKQHMLDIRRTGDLDRAIEPETNDELGVLAQEFSDLTNDLGGARKELEAARDQALAVSNAKSEFMARMSHEIRTPMNGVLGMVELLGGTPLSRDQRRYVHAVRDSANSLLDIINDILDFSKIEAGKLKLDLVRFDLNTFLTDITESLNGLARQKGLQLNCALPAGPGLAVEGDPIRLRQVLVNLLGNAIKFTEEGTVVLRATSSPDAGDYVRVRFEVSDTGIGIDRRKQQQIFDSFAQEDGSTTRRYGGTGLGLSISKQLVDLMGGDITLESEVGQGSTFAFELRLWAVREDALSDSVVFLDVPPQDTASDNGMPGHLQGRVLVAEDNAINLAVATDLLTRMGVEFDVAKDGQEVLDKVAAQAFDAVLMDCQMPVIDGYEATRRIRRIELRDARPPLRIIAVTAHVLAGDMEKCVAAGMDDYLRKPFTGKQLHSALAKVLPEGAPEPEPRADRSRSVPAATGDAEAYGSAVDESALSALAELPRYRDGDLLTRVVEAYLANSKSLLSKLGTAIDQGDADCIRTAAKAVASNSEKVGASRLAELCNMLATSTRKSDAKTARELQRQVQEEYEKVRTALRRKLESAA